MWPVNQTSAGCSGKNQRHLDRRQRKRKTAPKHPRVYEICSYNEALISFSGTAAFTHGMVNTCDNTMIMSDNLRHTWCILFLVRSESVRVPHVRVSQERAYFNYYRDVKRTPYFNSWDLLYVADNADAVASIKSYVPVEINTVLITYDCVRVKVHACAWGRTWVIRTYLAALWTGRVVRLHVVFEGVGWVEVWRVADGAVRDVGRGGRGKDGRAGERQRRMWRWTPGGDNCTHRENSYFSDGI